MECLLGITGPDYCILAADATVARSIVVMKPGEHKFRTLTPTTAMCYSGEPGDAANFADFVQCNVRLEALRWDRRELRVEEVAAFTRKTLADSLRSRSPYSVNLLIGGVEAGQRGQLYWLDYLGSMVQVPFGAHGYGAYLCYGLMDRLYRSDLSVPEAMDLLRKCLLELNVRFTGNLPEFHVKIIKADGSVDNVVLRSDNLYDRSS